MKKRMKMKLLDYTLIGLLAGMAPLAGAQTAAPSRPPSQAQQDGLATICATAGFGFGVHRSDHPPEMALLTLYQALAAR